METTKNDLAEAEKKLLEADDRGVFGTEGMKNISASVRQRFRRALEPRSATAWKMLREEDDALLPDIEKMLTDCLPRNEEDLKDDRYFGIHWGLGEVAMRKSDPTAALLHYEQAIRTFPKALRKSHIQRLETLGILTANHILTTDTRTAETDAAAIATRVLHAISIYRENGVGERIQDFYANLEHDDGRGAARPAFPRAYLA